MTKLNISKTYEDGKRRLNTNQKEEANRIFSKIKEINILGAYYYNFTLQTPIDDVFESLFTGILELSDSGDSEAVSVMANYYYFGHKPVERDTKKAIVYYLLGASQNHSFCQNYMANCYYYGNGIERDLDKAIFWYKTAAKNGNPNSMNNLANRYLYGEGVFTDYKKALYWYKKASVQQLGYAQTNIGIMYQFGLGLKQNSEKAIQWFLKSAKNNYGRAEDYLGDSYKYGRGVDVDYNKALYWYERAIQHNNIPTLLEAGDIYLQGMEVDKDENKANEYFKRAYEHFTHRMKSNDVMAYIHVAKMYKRGWYLPQSYDQMMIMYERAAKLKNPEAMFKLGYLHQSGVRSETNIAKAIFWYEEASKTNNIEASNALGKIYLEGEHISKDIAKAIQYFQIGEAQNNGEALYYLGIIFYYGMTNKRDQELALKYFKKSYDNSFSTANYYIDLISRELNPHQHTHNEMNKFGISLVKKRFSNDKKMVVISKKLEKEFSQTWDFLSNITRQKLKSALISYIDKISYENIESLDYSGVVLELNTALENEISIYLYKNYLDYAFKRKIKPRELALKRHFKNIDFNGDEKKKPREWPYFSLGDLKIISGYQKNHLNKNNYMNINLSKCFVETRQHKEVVYCFSGLYLDYLEEALNDKVFNKSHKRLSIMKFLKNYVDDVDVLRRDYRNKAAHGIVMTNIDAEVCANWIIKVKKLIHYLILLTMHHEDIEK